MNTASPLLHSAMYEGVVTHRRTAPKPHAFTYRIAQLYLDLDELDRVFASRWLWSTHGPNLAEFRRSDYLGPATVPLAEAVRDLVGERTGNRPGGPVRMLTHLRYAGYVFNPVSFYYCHAADGEALTDIVAEITNTPWKEHHTYVLPMHAALRRGHSVEWDFAKSFHVSPFVGMERQYAWRFTVPDERLRVQMLVLRKGERELEAGLDLRRRPICGASLARVLWRFPLMTTQVIAAIHWQALRLWLKRTPVYDHPRPLGGSR
ncbi:MAG TPA: DUF1365 domain-containing protein [Steroidobacteraceae bacterium]|nr:DUF1365 domain-containing protein [Steroidobacteraceae bacterium]